MNETTTSLPVAFQQVFERKGKKIPAEIELVRTGYWPTKRHGTFEVTEADIDEAIEHFNNGVYRVTNDDGRLEPLPVTLDHIGGTSPAAAWIYEIYKRYTDQGQAVLMGKANWTELGKEKLLRDEYRYVSFEFNPRAFPFVNPENAGETLVNVLTAATLTNDPLFKKQRPVMASVKAGVCDNSKEGDSMDLATIRAKKPEDLTEDEKKFLIENQAELTDEERTAFGIEVEKTADETEEEKKAREEAEAKKAEEEEAAKKAAEEAEKKEDVKASAGIKGTVTISADELDKLKAGAAAGIAAKNELLKTQLTASVKSHIERGAIKSDQMGEAVDILMASTEPQRERLNKFLEALPSNTLVTAGAQGSGADAKEVDITEAEKQYAEDFGLSTEDLKAYKEAQAK